MMNIEAISGARQALPGTPLEDLLFILRRRASAQPSAEASDIGRFEEEEEEEDISYAKTEADTSDVINITMRRRTG
jgi:hypothetical protein